MEQAMDTKLKIVYQEEKKDNKLSILFVDLLIVCMLQLGFLIYIQDWTCLEMSYRIKIYAITGICTLCSALIFYFSGKKLLSIILSPCAAIIFVLLSGVQSLYYGFFGFINYVISWWNVNKEDGVTLFMESNITFNDIYTFVLFLALLVTAVWFILIYDRHFLAAFIPALLVVTVGLVIGRFSAIGCSMLVTGCLGIWLLRVRKRHGVQQIGWLIALGILLIGISVAASDGPMSAVVHFRERLENNVRYIRYGDDTLPKGDLYKADKMLATDNDTLIVTTSQNKTMYLRGFVGDRYKDGRWSMLPKLSYKGEKSGMLKWLKNLDFVPQNQYADYIKNDDNSQIKKNTVKIENVGADRSYIYMPYSAVKLNQLGISTSYDNNYTSDSLFGKKNYQYDEWSGTRPGELLYADSWISSPQSPEQTTYVEAERVYADFVYDNYLEIDDNMSKMINAAFFDGWQSDDTIYSVTERIRDVLGKKAYYVEVPESIPDDVEPVNWFLNKGHQGNSVMFATTAVLAFRAQGIPARYVEGYLVSENDIKNSDNGSVTLTNKDSHAWVEVYLDGVGFIPIDVTPGFYYDTYTLLQMVQKPQNVSQTAAEEDSSESGNEVDDKGSEGDSSTTADKHDRIIRIPLTILAYIVLVLIIIIAAFEFNYFVYMLTYESKYNKLGNDIKVRILMTVILRLITLYGYKAELGWNVDDTDAVLSDNITDIYRGEYTRITNLIEKNIYGQEELSSSEIKVIYNFAHQLYEARRDVKLVTRLKIRYMPCFVKKAHVSGK